MLQGNRNRRLRIALGVFLTGLLVAVRAFESQLFYDPFVLYFKSEYTALPYPDYNGVLLFAHWILRYVLNSVISVLLLYVIFKEMEVVKFASFLLFVFLTVLIPLLYVLLEYSDESQKMLLFYVRRFVIQPLFVLLFIPGFYFQKQFEKK